MATTMTLGTSSDTINLKETGNLSSKLCYMTLNDSGDADFDNYCFVTGTWSKYVSEIDQVCTGPKGYVYLYSSSSGYAGVWCTFSDSNSYCLTRTDGSSIYYGSSSDRRFKTETGKINKEEAVAILSNVNPIIFYYNNDDYKIPTTGLYAQDVRDALINNNIGYRDYLLIEPKESDINSEFIQNLTEDEDNVKYGLDYVKLIPTLIKGWQVHKERIDDLKKQNKELKQEIAELEALLDE